MQRKRKFGEILSGCWDIELRERSCHPGKKAWLLYDGREVYSLDERGLRKRGYYAPKIPEDVERDFLKCWENYSTGRKS